MWTEVSLPTSQVDVLRETVVKEYQKATNTQTVEICKLYAATVRTKVYVQKNTAAINQPKKEVLV